MLLSMLVIGAATPVSALLRGDADADGTTSSSDARLIIRAITEETAGNLEKAVFTAADYNGDDKITTTDVRGVLGSLMGNKVDYLDIQKRDVLGDHSITILGDSIGHGSATGDIPNNSYVGRLNHRITELTGSTNYGFTSVEGTLWNTPLAYEMHSFPTSTTGYKNPGEAGDAWTEHRTAWLLGTKGLGGTKHWSGLIFTVQKTFKYFCVYYEAGPSYGTFSVATLNSDGNGIDLPDVNGNVMVNCRQETETYRRTAMYDMSQLIDNKICIAIQSDDNSEVIITGIGYYDDPDAIVVNNFSNGGLELGGNGPDSYGNITGLDYKFLDMASQADVLIFELGGNDAHFDSDLDVFEQKIDYLVKKVKQNNCKLIVNDTVFYIPEAANHGVWMDKTRIDWVKGQLKRLAEETGGIYIDQQGTLGDSLINTIGDYFHPSAEGHRMMAELLFEAMGID